MKTFQIRTCPLCSKKLKIGDEKSTYSYYCEEFFLRSYSFIDRILYHDDYINGYYKEPHYSVIIENGMWRQSTVIPPYWIISESGVDKSKIFKFQKRIEMGEHNLLMEIPFINPSDYLPEVFAKKIKNLVIFT